MTAVILLGANDEYLGYKQFDFNYQADLFIDKLEPLMVANIERKLPLRERLQLAPEYFPFAGCVQDIDVIQLNQTKENQNGNG
jgi:hypothetical protein